MVATATATAAATAAATTAVSATTNKGTMIRRRVGMHKKNISLLLLVTVMVALLMTMIEQAMANPLQRLLMKNPKQQNDAEKQGSMMKAANNKRIQNNDGDNKGGKGDDVDTTCVDPEIYFGTLQKEKEVAEDKIETLTLQLEEAVENSKRMTELKEDLVHEMAKLQSQSAKELSHVRDELAVVKATLEAKEQEFTTTRNKWEERLDITRQLAEVGERETENLWKREMEIVKTNAQLEIQSAQHDAQTKCHEQMEHRLSKLAEETRSCTSGANANSDRQQVMMLEVERLKIKVLEDETKLLETQLVEQKVTMQQLVDQVEGRYEAKFNERERELQEQYNEQIQQLEEREACQSALDKLKKTQEQHLAKYMELCNQVEVSLEQEKSVNLELSQKQTQLQDTIDQLKQQKETEKTELQSAMAQLEQQKEMEKQSSEQDKETLKGGHVAVVQALNEEHAVAIKELKNNIIHLEQDADNLKNRHVVELQQTELRVQTEWQGKLNQTATELRQEMQTAHERTTKLQVGLEANIEQTKQVLQQQTLTVQERNVQVTQLTKELKEAKREVEYWEQVFGNRSYFNSTHVQDDALYWIGQRKRALTTKWIKHVWNPWKKQTEPHRKRVQTWYHRYLKKHVDPLYQLSLRVHTQYVVPNLIQPVQDTWSHFVTAVQTQCRQLFQSVVADIRRACPQLKQLVKKQPDFIRNNVNKICQQPEQALSQSLWFVLVVMVILFRNQIGRFVLQLFVGVWWLLSKLVVWVLQLLWFLSPIRWLLRILYRTKEQDSMNKGPNDPTPTTTRSKSGRTSTNGVKKQGVPP